MSWLCRRCYVIFYRAALQRNNCSGLTKCRLPVHWLYTGKREMRKVEPFTKWEIFQDERRIIWESIIEKLSTKGAEKIESSAAQRPMLIRRLRLVSSTQLRSLLFSRFLHSFTGSKVLNSGVAVLFLIFCPVANFPNSGGHGIFWNEHDSFNSLCF